MSILKFGNDVLRVEQITIRKPVSMWSDDPTDFQYKKYIQTRAEYYLNDVPISKEQANEWIAAHVYEA